MGQPRPVEEVSSAGGAAPGRISQGRCPRPEPYEAKVSSTVLRGREGSNPLLLPGGTLIFGRARDDIKPRLPWSSKRACGGWLSVADSDFSRQPGPRVGGNGPCCSTSGRG